MLAKIEALPSQMAACKRCGAELPPGALTCPSCPPRAVANPWTAPALPPGFAQAPAQAAPQFAASSGWIAQAAGVSPTAMLPKAGFGIRLVAWLIDLFITVVGGGLLDVIIGIALPPGEAAIFQFIVLIFQGLYWSFMWSDSIGNGQTIGMSVFNLRLLRKSTGQPIGVTRAVGRELMLLLFWWLSWVAAFDSDKQAIHDKIVDTVVVVER
jgi:uncharacterized RDD family membrane protein YckC/ribosomal protein L40E